MVLQSVFEKMKLARKLRFMTNCYSPKSIENILGITEHGDSFVLICEDHGIKRLIFFADSQETLEILLGKLPRGEFFLEYMTKNPDTFSLESCAPEARLKRYVNPDCSSVFSLESRVLKYRDDTVGEAAKIADASEINALLWSVFRTEISHLQTDKELAEQIEKDNVYIHRSDKIDAVLQTDILPKKFYINQVVNKAEPSVIHAIMLKRLGQYVQNGGKYLYSWIEEENIASIKFHEKYDMHHDGMWNLVFRAGSPAEAF